jgi:hypothetical protein
VGGVSLLTHAATLSMFSSTAHATTQPAAKDVMAKWEGAASAALPHGAHAPLAVAVLQVGVWVCGLN